MNLTITRAAKRFIRMMLTVDGGPDSAFRMTVKPGGCSGLSADIAVAAEPATDEMMITVDGVKLLLNAHSRILLQDVTIDFDDGAASNGLVFHDPKQQPRCVPPALDAA